MSSTMRAVFVRKYGGPEVMQLEEIPIPRPSGKQVLIKMKAAGVNAVDFKYISNTMPEGSIPVPFVPGIDGSGIVAEIGSEVQSVKVGDRVYVTWAGHRNVGNRPYAEYSMYDERSVFPLPDNISFKEGAVLGVPYFTAYVGLFHRCRAKSGEVFLMHGGSGAIGIAGIQWARSRGMFVIATAGTKEGLELVKKVGAHHAVNHREPDHDKVIMNLTGGRGVDVILEMAPSINLAMDIELVTHGGRIGVIGTPGPIEIKPQRTYAKESSINGVGTIAITPEVVKEVSSALYAGLELGFIQPVVGTEFPLEKAADAVRVREKERSGALGQYVLTM
ncbi:quinone oxidoreductase-like [Ptychodera flava]|uniref:quinone oxidoreductase-like n=1 Tax=Ptychodera flava TaxID=63121 RepID=UPI003969DB13